MQFWKSCDSCTQAHYDPDAEIIYCTARVASYCVCFSDLSGSATNPKRLGRESAPHLTIYSKPSAVTQLTVTPTAFPLTSNNK